MKNISSYTFLPAWQGLPLISAALLALLLAALATRPVLAQGPLVSQTADINPGSGGSDPQYLAVFDNKLYFNANDGSSGYELWGYDGVGAPSRVADIWSGGGGSDPKYLTVFDNKLYFSANDGSSGYELWVYDGMGAPSQVADIWSGGVGSSPQYLAVFDDKLYFSANDGSSGYELWGYDGVSAPSRVADIKPGSGDSFPEYLTVFNDKLYFRANDGSSGNELWGYDGVGAPSRVADIWSGGLGSSPHYLAVFDNKLYFSANDGSSGYELWGYDGVGAPSQVADIKPDSDSYPGNLTVFDNKLYFSANDGSSGSKLWVYDGVSAPSRVADIWPGSGSLFPGYLTVFDNKLYFRTNDGSSGNELWVYDGVNAPSRVADINPDSGDSFPEYLAVFDNKLYFRANDGSSGRELWQLAPPPVVVSKTVDDTTPDPGQLLTYQIVIDNLEIITQTNAVISDTLPAGLTFAGPVSLTGAGGAVAQDAGDLPTLASGLSIAPGQTITVTLPVTVDTGLSSGLVITNTAAMTSSELSDWFTHAVTVTINNVAPSAVDDAALVMKNNSKQLDVLANDSDAYGDSLSLTQVGATDQGGSAMVDSSQVTYSPATDFTGTESFTYTISDGSLTDTATVTALVVEGDGGGILDPGDSDGETIVIPGTGISQTITVTVQIPAGVATDTFALVYDEVETPSGATPEGFVLAGLSFTLDAYLNQQLQPGYVFATPISLTVAYSDEDVADLPGGETSLQLRHWTGSEWSSDGISKLSQDTVHNTAIFQLEHLSEFALFGTAQSRVYLPLLVK